MNYPASTDRVLALIAATALGLAACSGKQPTAQADPNALEGALDMIAWPGYIERGASDKKYDWVTKFEQDTGCKVNVKIAGTSD